MSLEGTVWEGATSDEIYKLEAAEEEKNSASCVIRGLQGDIDYAQRDLSRMQRELDQACDRQQKAGQRLRELEAEIGRRIIARKAGSATQ